LPIGLHDYIPVHLNWTCELFYNNLLKRAAILFLCSLQEVCKQKSEAFEMQFDEYIGQLQQCKDSIIGELSSRLRKEMAKLQNTIDDIDRQENDLDKAIKEITDIMKCDKLKVLKVVYIASFLLSF
jgi:uncharacterized protein YPO0396